MAYLNKKTFDLVNDFFKSNMIPASKEQIEQIVCYICNFERQTQMQILKKIDFQSRTAINDLYRICKNGGYTDTELYYNGMEIIGNMFRDVNTDDCDLVFADVRACIAFKMIFENFHRFLDVKETDKELFYSEKFSKAYASVNPEIYPNILNNYYIQQGDVLSTDHRYVVFVGDPQGCEIICNEAYGEGNWQRIKYEFKLKFKKPAEDHKIPQEMDYKQYSGDFDSALKQLEAEEAEENQG